MAFSTYWTQLQMKNPGLNEEDTKMTISVGSFKSALRRAYDSGGENTAKALRDLEMTGKPDYKDLFGGMFG